MLGLITKGVGAAAAINTAVSDITNDPVLGLVKKAGVVNVFGGGLSETRITLSSNTLHYSEINLTSFGYTPRMYQLAFNLIASDKIKVESFNQR